jgi:hypothetical protein
MLKELVYSFHLGVQVRKINVQNRFFRHVLFNRVEVQALITSVQQGPSTIQEERYTKDT